MNLRLYDNEKNITLIEKQYPDWNISADEGIIESTTFIEHFFSKGFYREILFEGVHIGFGNTSLRNNIRIDFESDFETVEMHFAIKGKSTVNTDVIDKSISFASHQHNIIYANRICGKMHLDSDQFQLLEINLAPELFSKFLPQDHHLFDAFRNAMAGGKSGLLAKSHYPVSHKMYQIVDEIIHCKRHGMFKRMFLEAKVIELILLQLEQFAANTVLHPSIKKSDVDKMYAVREFILNNLDAACSLIDLAHKVGTNEFILKKGFKELFGTTVFAFWNDTKMEQAKLLLTEHDMTVGEVSQYIGYKNQRHFSAAFKRQFGIVPSQFKK